MTPPATPHVTLSARNPACVQIGLCTDTHLWLNGTDRHGGEQNRQLLGASERLLNLLIDELAASESDAVIHLGDFTCGGGYFHTSPGDFYAAADVSRAAFSDLPVVSFGLPGNHDCLPGGTDWRYVEKQWGLEPGLGRTLDTPHARLVLLNTQGHSPAQVRAGLPEDPVYGWVSDDELQRLDWTLASAGEKPILLFAHQLLRPWADARAWKDYYGVRNADAVLKIMASHGNVRAVFQGHAHMYNMHDAQVGPSVCRFVVTPATIEYPVAWLQLALTAEQLRVRLRFLPAPGLREASRASGAGQEWRSGRQTWHDCCIDLR